jgi:hypothetical protein
LARVIDLRQIEPRLRRDMPLRFQLESIHAELRS